VTEHGDSSAIGAREAREDADEGSFTGPVGTKQAEKLAFFYDEVHAFERLQLFVALLDVAYFYG
jgi:hypothetical protein